jgi:hypothetical protein
MMNGRILKCCKIPIKAEMNTIGRRTFKKKGDAPSFTIPTNTKVIPSFAHYKSFPKPSAIELMITKPNFVFNNK